MSNRAVESIAADASVVDVAAARNASIELNGRARDGRTVSARCRILGTEDGRILLDHPQCAGRPVAFPTGRRLVARLRLGGAWYAFECDVVTPARLVRLNARKQVVGVAISRPERVEATTQRRRHFRVRFLAGAPIPLALHEAGSGADGACPVRARRFTADLLDLSAGGAGIRLPEEEAARLAVGTRLFGSFALPGETLAFAFLLEVRQLRPAAATGAGPRAGLEILEWPSPRALDRTRQRLQRHLTRVERGRLTRGVGPHRD